MTKLVGLRTVVCNGGLSPCALRKI